jgi:hypothetical protein
MFVCDVSLSVYPHRASLKNMLAMVRIEPTTLIEILPTVAGIFFKLARCGYTLKVTSQKSYSPEYTTPTQNKMI